MRTIEKDTIKTYSGKERSQRTAMRDNLTVNHKSSF